MASMRARSLSRESQVAEGGNVLLNLFHAAGADQCRGDPPIAEHPRQSHLRQRLPALLGQLVQSPDLGELAFVDVAFFQKAVRLRCAGIRRDALQIAIGKQSLCQRTERNAAYAFLPSTSSSPRSGVRSNIEYFG